MCDEVQGYLIGRPMPMDEPPELIAMRVKTVLAVFPGRTWASPTIRSGSVGDRDSLLTVFGSEWLSPLEGFGPRTAPPAVGLRGSRAERPGATLRYGPVGRWAGSGEPCQDAGVDCSVAS